jgi:hypothetical protein
MRLPSLRGAYDAIERELEPRLEALTRGTGFAQVSAFIAETRSAVGARTDAWNARVLHSVNLPAGTDITRLRRQIGELDREVRVLRLELAELADKTREVRRDARSD